MSEIVIRVFSRSGRSRISLKKDATLGDLKEVVKNRLNVSPENQIFRIDQGGPLRGSDSALLQSLGVQNGTILHLDAEAEVTNKDVFVRPVLTESAPPQPEEKKDSRSYDYEHVRECRHGPKERCINCLAKEDAKKKQEGTDSPKKEDMSWLCHHGPGGKCVNCLKDDFVANIKHESFEHYMLAKRAKCEHGREAVCPNCLPPADVSYKLKSCDRHPPWPHSICSYCMPNTAVLARQPYRHVDYVELMNVTEITNFVRYWQQSHCMQQRVGFMYGYYAEDPNYPEGVRAVMEAIYEPPQIGDMNGHQIIEDSYKEVADMIAGALELESIGWIFTSINHDAYLSSHEIRQAAKFQQEHLTDHPSGYKVSKYATVVLKPTDDGNSMPEAYMVSDQAQALERDNVFGDSESRRLLKKRETGKDEILPTVMSENSPKEEFQPEWFIVNLGCGIPKKPMTILHHNDFPVENRDKEVGTNDIKNYLKKHKNEPGFRKCSDFHFLVHLAKMLDVESALIAAQCVAHEQELPLGLQELLNSLV